jgi:thioesterase domain-containing protein
MTTRRWKRLVLIKAGLPSRPAFFCVHGAGGDVLNLGDIAGRLAPGQPVYGIEARGMDGEERPHEDLLAMAAEYLCEIRQAQPQGPYLLGGYSGGGIVAFEMAQQLTAAKEKVGMLVFLDTFSPLIELRKISFGARLQQVRGEGLGYLRGVGIRYLAKKRFRRDEQALEALLARGATVPPQMRETHVMRAFHAAVRNYKARPWSGRAMLFSAEVVAFVFSGSGPSYAWEKLIDQLDVRKVPGNHATLLLEPQVGGVAAALDQAFAQQPDVAIHEAAGQT